MLTAAKVREIGGFDGLTDQQIGALIPRAVTVVAEAVATLGITPGADEIESLETLKACEMAARLARPPKSESRGQLSMSFAELNWRFEYARELNRVAAANGGLAKLTGRMGGL